MCSIPPTCDQQAMTIEADKVINTLMLDFRELVLGIQEEGRALRAKLRDLPLQTGARKAKTTTTTTSSSTNSQSLTASSTIPTASPATFEEPSAATLSSASYLSSGTLTTGGSTKPPSYKSIDRPPIQETHYHHPPQPPVRTRRRAKTTTSTSSILHNNNNHNRISSTMSLNSLATRGAFIVLEGLDRVGKSTLAKKLVEHLDRTKRPVAYYRFPDRTTPIGRVIDDFLKTSSKRIDDHAMHLLFSANRWELNKEIRNTLAQGTTIIVDRYSYSGIAYSAAKKNLTIEWCCETEKGLPQPDLVIFLELPKEAQYKRPGFGDERFESRELQELIRHQYEQIMDISRETWLRIDVENKSPDQVLGEIIVPVKRCLEASANKELGNLQFL